LKVSIEIFEKEMHIQYIVCIYWMRRSHRRWGHQGSRHLKALWVFLLALPRFLGQRGRGRWPGKAITGHPAASLHLWRKFDNVRIFLFTVLATYHYHPHFAAPCQYQHLLRFIWTTTAMTLFFGEQLSYNALLSIHLY